MSTDALNQRFLLVPRYAIVVSLVLHLAFPFSFLVLAGLDQLGLHVIPERKRPPIQEVYQTYIQVDVVALPDQTYADKSSVDPTMPLVDSASKAPEESKLPDAMTQQVEAQKQAETELAERKAEEEKRKADEKKKKSAEDEKKKAETEKKKALDKLQKEADREAALKALAKKDGKAGRQKLAGNKVSKGTSSAGALGTMKEAYGALVKQKISDHFHILPGQNKKGLVTIVHIELTPQGRLRERRIVRSSRDPIFDAAVLQAVIESQPLPAPEDPAIIADGITLEFRPESK